MSKKVRIHDDSFAVNRSYSVIWDRDDNYSEGTIVTAVGIVKVRSQSGRNTYTRLDFVWLGRHYIRRYNTRYTHRGLVRKANRFIIDIIMRKA